MTCGRVGDHIMTYRILEIKNTGPKIIGAPEILIPVDVNKLGFQNWNQSQLQAKIFVLYNKMRNFVK